MEIEKVVNWQVSAEHLAPYANRLSSLSVPDLAHGTNLAQSANDVLPEVDKSLS